jgi:hypothetical protein
VFVAKIEQEEVVVVEEVVVEAVEQKEFQQ